MATSKSLGIIGIILGLMGVILGGYVFFDNAIAPSLGLKDPASVITNYYDSHQTYYFDGTDPEDLTTSVIISISGNTDVYVMFNCYAYLTTGEWIAFDISIDGTKVTYSPMMVSGDQRESVSLQYYTNSLTSGSYEISVIAETSDEATTYLSTLSLFVQTKI